MFFLGRWSATGLFPLIPEMMADTAAHVAAHREQIARITDAGFCWYRSEGGYGEDREETVIGPRLRPLTDYSVPKAIRARGQTELAQWRLDSHSLVRFTACSYRSRRGASFPGYGESMPDGPLHAAASATLWLERCDPTRRMLRFYALELTPDLFGGWSLN